MEGMDARSEVAALEAADGAESLLRRVDELLERAQSAATGAGHADLAAGFRTDARRSVASARLSCG